MDKENTDILGHVDTKNVDFLGPMDTENANILGHMDTENEDKKCQSQFRQTLIIIRILQILKRFGGTNFFSKNILFLGSDADGVLCMHN